ncbi:MAG: hypothetical protein ACJAX5_000243 [Patiriisocius sp.]
MSITAIFQVYRHRRVSFFGALLGVTASIGVLGIVGISGVEEVHFIYHVVIFTYFLISPRVAFLLSAELPIFHLIKIGVSIIACTAFAFSG